MSREKQWRTNFFSADFCNLAEKHIVCLTDMTNNKATWNNSLLNKSYNLQGIIFGYQQPKLSPPPPFFSPTVVARYRSSFVVVRTIDWHIYEQVYSRAESFLCCAYGCSSIAFDRHPTCITCSQTFWTVCVPFVSNQCYVPLSQTKLRKFVLLAKGSAQLSKLCIQGVWESPRHMSENGLLHF